MQDSSKHFLQCLCLLIATEYSILILMNKHGHVQTMAEWYCLKHLSCLMDVMHIFAAHSIITVFLDKHWQPVTCIPHFTFNRSANVYNHKILFQSYFSRFPQNHWNADKEVKDICNIS